MYFNANSAHPSFPCTRCIPTSKTGLQTEYGPQSTVVGRVPTNITKINTKATHEYTTTTTTTTTTPTTTTTTTTTSGAGGFVGGRGRPRVGYKANTVLRILSSDGYTPT